jgi:hypothetical protein
VCKWFALGLMLDDLGEFLLAKFVLFLGVMVEASLVQLFYKFTLFHRLPLLENYLYCFKSKENPPKRVNSI